MNNTIWKHPVWFKVSDSKQYYMYLTEHTFKDFTSDWIKNVHNCYIISLRSINANFEPFQLLSPLAVIFKIDGEETPFNNDQHETNLNGTKSLSDSNHGSLHGSENSEELE